VQSRLPRQRVRSMCVPSPVRLPAGTRSESHLKELENLLPQLRVVMREVFGKRAGAQAGKVVAGWPRRQRELAGQHLQPRSHYRGGARRLCGVGDLGAGAAGRAGQKAPRAYKKVCRVAADRDVIKCRAAV
jgi:hypothetical protein